MEKINLTANCPVKRGKILKVNGQHVVVTRCSDNGNIYYLEARPATAEEIAAVPPPQPKAAPAPRMTSDGYPCD